MTTTLTRPDSLAAVVGQAELLERMRIIIHGAKVRGVPVPHILLSGPAGHGKTTVCRVIADELGVPMIATTGPALKRGGDLAGILMKAEPGTVIFIDEVHRMPMAVEETLYEALEDSQLSIIVGSGTGANAIVVKLPPLVIVGATTMPGALSTPLRNRFGFHGNVKPYDDKELAEIVGRSWAGHGARFDGEAAHLLAERSKGVPRLALHLAARVLDYGAVEGASLVSVALVDAALDAFGISANGLDELDVRILEALVLGFSGKPVGLANLAQFLDVDVKTIQEEHEGPLVRAGYMVRTAGGRIATPQAHALIREAQ